MNNTQTQKKNKKQSNLFKKCDLDEISRKLKFWSIDIKIFFCEDAARRSPILFGD